VKEPGGGLLASTGLAREDEREAAGRVALDVAVDP
jgi:hypothetical protein